MPVQRGATPTVAALAARDAAALVPRGQATVDWTLEPRAVEAPVAKGDTVGDIIVRQGEAEVMRVPALAADSVERRPWWKFWGG